MIILKTNFNKSSGNSKEDTFDIRRIIINHLMLRVYYLPSEELTFTPKFRENFLDKTCEN